MNDKDEQAQRAHLFDLAAQAGGEPLDPNDLAQLAAGQPSAEVRAALEAKLVAASADDVGTVAGVAAARDIIRGHPSSVRRRWWIPVSVAALLLVTVGVWWATRDAAPPGPLDDGALLVAFQTLRAEAPAAFDGVEPVLHAERIGAEAIVRRGGIRVFRPHGAVLKAPGSVHWQGVDGARSYEVLVLSEDGDEILRTTTETSGLAWPPGLNLTQGTAYVVRVSTLVGGVRAQGSAAFRRLSAPEHAAYVQGLHAIDGLARADARPVLRAQLALRRGLIQETRRFLAEAEDATDGQVLLEEMRALVARVHGTD